MSDFQLSLPIVALVGGAIAILLLKPRSVSGPNPVPPGIALLATLISLVCLWRIRPPGADAFTGMSGFLVADALGVTSALLIVVATAITVVLSGDYLKKVDANHPEYFALLLLCASGMMVMVLARHLVPIFLGLEIMSLSLYILAAFMRHRPSSAEAGMKYFLAGSFASGLFIMGIALAWGGSGAMDLDEIGKALAAGSPLAKAGVVLLFAGFAFKLALAPFHQWAPDVYEGAPTPVAGFMSTAVKLAAFTAFVRAAVPAVREHGVDGSLLRGGLVWLAVLTMLVGNIGAFGQKSVKRMLAYSSIGHAGYLLLAPAAWSDASTEPLQALVFYLASYTLTNLLAFGALAFIETREGRALTFDDLSGLRWRHPAMALALLIAVLSLAGIPPTAGFLAKFRLFGAVIEQGTRTGDRTYFFLAGVAILTSLISLGYYLRVIVVMYMREPRNDLPRVPRFSPAHRFAMLALMLLVVWLGVGPTVLGVGADALIRFASGAAAGHP